MQNLGLGLHQNAFGGAPPDPLAAIRGPTSKGRGRGGDGEREGKGKDDLHPTLFLGPGRIC